MIYWDPINRKLIPGLAESWEVTPDGLSLTYHLRKGVQWQGGWGEFTSADVKFNFEMHASKTSVGKTSQTRKIASMDAPDPYTLVVNFKEPYPTFFVDLSLANSAVCQGIVCKKYIETAGEDAAAEKPIGTGPYKWVESKLGSYHKLEALDSHWRVIPEFKNLIVRLISETSSIVAALKNKEIDMSLVPAEQLANLKSAGVAVEVSESGGGVQLVSFGGMVLSEDKRYDAAYHNKDPWTDPKIRKAMAISIDREAICKAIYAGYAKPAGAPLISMDFDKFQYPYDPAAAKQLLKDAGYPNGFSFKVISYTPPALPETPRIMEALAGFWQQIGLDPKITVVDYNTYLTKNCNPCKTANEVALTSFGPVGDMLSKVDVYLIPNASTCSFKMKALIPCINLSTKNATFEERLAAVNKLNQYYFDNIGPIPVVRAGLCYAWNADKISAWPHADSSRPTNCEYVRHVQPLNTFRLFNPWPGR